MRLGRHSLCYHKMFQSLPVNIHEEAQAAEETGRTPKGSLFYHKFTLSKTDTSLRQTSDPTTSTTMMYQYKFFKLAQWSSSI